MSLFVLKPKLSLTHVPHRLLIGSCKSTGFGGSLHPNCYPFHSSYHQLADHHESTTDCSFLSLKVNITIGVGKKNNQFVVSPSSSRFFYMTPTSESNHHNEIDYTRNYTNNLHCNQCAPNSSIGASFVTVDVEALSHIKSSNVTTTNQVTEANVQKLETEIRLLKTRLDALEAKSYLVRDEPNSGNSDTEQFGDRVISLLDEIDAHRNWLQMGAPTTNDEQGYEPPTSARTTYNRRQIKRHILLTEV